MEAAELSPALVACREVAIARGLRVDDVVVLNNSNRLAVLLRPCDLLARVAPLSRLSGAQFEVDIACRLAGTGAPLGLLDSRVEQRVFEHGNFAVTLWTYYEPVPPDAVEPDEYAGALAGLHSALRRTDLASDRIPHFMDRVVEAQRLVNDPLNDAAISRADRELVARTLRTMSRAVLVRTAHEQVLHGEPHPGNVLRTSDGLRFIDLETCCRGPVEFDIAHAAATASGPPVEIAAHYGDVDQTLVRDCWILMLAMVIAWRFEPGDDLPNGREMTRTWIRQLRAAVERDNA